MSGLSSNAALADALAGLARQQGAAAPAVRGSDWRQAIVYTVDPAGTVTTTDGITARRLDSYRYPAVGDRIVVSVASSGGWIAVGRLAPTTGGGWQYPSFRSGWADYGGAYQRVRYRRHGGEVVIEGLVQTTSSQSGTTTIFVLPEGYRPPLHVVTSQMGNGPTPRQVNVRSSGEVDAMSLSSGTNLGFLSLQTRFALT